MAGNVTHTITQTYSGGGSLPVARTINQVGQSQGVYQTQCAGATTTTLSPPLVMDPDALIQAYCLLATGNCSLIFDATSGSDSTVTLTANTAKIQVTDETTDLISGVPTAADTYTLKVVVPGSDSISVDLRFLFQ